ncbi:DNA gyrase subunit A [Methanotrichaceae archaeon M04Ac]|uniref:DNA gyrase subunit A n=1 Tax=Candidatus Methanocrinis alkalitolerans TaxID=3033395 RepID=A0ABT5XGU2_9EURY|nr:DNA gyrase subunit A [Candidatus Methanocrinis alkalitolerans]MCR3882948.1 DNA gyrase subunit A [Methanothrix sp.]MDF0593944.1 DNA gyrase subunit A [Candidatus Methanocrinis alkalitolerans]
MTEIDVDITSEMKSSYIDYAMSVIVGRALPDVRDGLKPVHRRILYAMFEQGMTSDQPYKKSARVVGDVMGKYHPHGDAAIYETMVRMAQDFSMRYPLIDGQGNFGSIDGDPAAAMRYTEVRLSEIAGEILTDIEKDTVDFVPNYDDSLKEPIVLPSKLPNLLVNGSSGIAVGMATNVPPHNLREVAGALTRLIDDPESTLSDLLEEMPGPDFPTGGYILGSSGIQSAYATGRGIIKLRAKSVIEQGEKQKIVVTELPYQVNKAKVVETIADLIKAERVDGISDLRDESDRDGIRLVVELRSGVNPEVLLNQLHRHTQLESSYSIINVVLVDGQPLTLPLKEILEQYILHRSEVIERRTRFDLNRAEKRAHVLAGLLVALENIDDVIKLIRAAESPGEARAALMGAFDLSEEQTKAILDMRLQRLTALEQGKIRSEVADLEVAIARFREILADPREVRNIIKQELSELVGKYGDERRTQIIEAEEEIDLEDLIQEEEVAVTITGDGYIKRQPLTAYRQQRRGGMGVMGAEIKSEDFVTDLFVATTHEYILFFTDMGKAHWLRVFDVPALGRAARGKSIVNLLSFEADERITEAIPVKSFDSEGFIVMATSKGQVVKTSIRAYSNPRKGGIKAVNLRGDSLVAARLTDGDQDLILATAHGKAIRFSEGDVRPSHRGSMGVRGISLEANDEVISMDVVRPGTALLTVTRKGYGKRTELSEYSPHRRGGKGMKNIDPRRGDVVASRTVSQEDELMITTKDGQMIRIPASDIRIQGRATQGVRIMRLRPGDEVAAVARIN